MVARDIQIVRTLLRLNDKIHARLPDPATRVVGEVVNPHFRADAEAEPLQLSAERANNAVVPRDKAAACPARDGVMPILTERLVAALAVAHRDSVATRKAGVTFRPSRMRIAMA